MKVFLHHIYEYNKGLRHLVLYTGPDCECSSIEEKLGKRGIPYVIQQIGAARVNVFFGDAACVEVVRAFAEKPLSEWTPKEDFILGIMLGYDRRQQCVRFLERNRRRNTCLEVNAVSRRFEVIPHTELPVFDQPELSCGSTCG